MAPKKSVKKKVVKKGANIGLKPQNAPIDIWGPAIISMIPGHP